MSNSLKAIESEILRDARAEADKQIQLANARAEEKIAAKRKELEKELALRKEYNSEEAAKKKARMLTGAALEERKMRLAAKQETIDLAFSNVIEAFEEMDKDRYGKWLSDLILAYAETGEERVLVSEGDKDLVDEAFLKKVNQKLEEQGKVGKLRLVEEAGEFAKGFVLQGELSEINCNLDALVKAVRKSLEAEVASVLFS
ncbi:V-type ATP synthase subunit E [Clostridia bacterium]|nr:V-type ATP synthase subunit E [Clostridia bacterium]